MGKPDKISVEKILQEKAEIIDKIIEKYLPKKYDEEALQKAIADPVWDLLERGGKRWRPALFLLVCEALGANVKKLYDFVVIPELVHNGTLMVDDIEDGSDLRRGKPCTYKIFGIDIAINAGNAIYFLPLLSLEKNKNKFKPETLLKVYETYIQEMTNLSFGQAMDIAWHKGIANADNLSEADYIKMCAYKTGTLARLSAKIACILSGASDELTERMGHFGESIGVAFQIQDDILNLVGKEFSEKKGLGEDITEGKRSLLVIHTLNIAKEVDKKRLLEILNMHTKDKKLILEAIGIIKKYGSIDYAKELAKRMTKDIWDGIDKELKPSDAKEKIRAFANYLIERKI